MRARIHCLEQQLLGLVQTKPRLCAQNPRWRVCNVVEISQGGPSLATGWSEGPPTWLQGKQRLLERLRLGEVTPATSWCGNPEEEGGGAAGKQLRLDEVTPADRLQAANQRPGVGCHVMAPEDHPEEAPVTPNWSLGGNPDQGRQDIAMPSRMAKVEPSVFDQHLLIWASILRTIKFDCV